MRRGRLDSARAGNVLPHSLTPYGYMVAETDAVRTLVPDPEEAPTVERIFEWYVQEGLSQRGIAQRLTERNVPTWGDRHGARRQTRGPCQWSPDTIRGILKNPVHKGQWQYKARGEDGNMPPPVRVEPIVSPEIWEAAQRRRRTNRQGTPRTKREYLLVGRIRCAECGYAMCATTHRGVYRYYVHSDSERRIRSCDHPVRVRADRVDDLAWTWLESLFLDRDHLRVALRQQCEEREHQAAPLRRKLTQADAQLRRHGQAMSTLLDRHLDGTIGAEEFRAKRAEREKGAEWLREERDRMAGELAQLTAGMPSITDEWLEYVDAIAEGLRAAGEDFALRREIVQRLDLRAEISVDAEGARILALRCEMGAQSFPVDRANTRTGTPNRERLVLRLRTVV